MNKNLKNEYPEMPMTFHKNVVSSFGKLDEKQEIKKHNRSPFKMIAFAAAIIVLMSVTGFAANTVYEKFINKENYKVTLELDEESTNTAKAPEYVKLNFGYMPDYLIPYDAPYKFSTEIKDDGTVCSGLTFQLFKSELAKDLVITYVESSAEYMFGENKGAVMHINSGVETDGDDYDKQFIIYFEEFGYVLRCHVSERISDDEMIKIANGLSLEKTDKEHAYIIDTYIPTVDNGGIIAPAFGTFSYTTDAVVRQLGEAFDIKAYNRDVDGNDYTLSVKSIDIRDNVNGLDYSSFDLAGEISDYVDENGNLKSYEHKTYNHGDGVNSISSLKESKTVGRKIVLVDIEVRNNESYANQFFINAGVFSISGTPAANGVNSFEASYISGQDGKTGSYNFIPFEAGEKKTLTYGYIIDADADFDDLMFIVESLWDVMNGVVIE